MSIKGFSTQKKLENDISGYLESQTKDSSQFITAQKTSSDKVLLDSTSNVIFRLHPAVKTVEANSTKRIIKISSHGAKAGDTLRFELSAQNPYFESGILSVPDVDTLILAAELPITPNVGDEFFLLRTAQLRTDESGALIVTVAPAPISFVLDGVDTEVEEDTGTPANSKPLPTKVLDGSGVEVDFATAAKQDESNTILNEISTNTLAAIKNTSGSVDNGTLVLTTQVTVNAPANAIGFIVQNESSNANSIRFNVGAVATAALGVLLEPGRDSGYIPIAANVSVCNTVSSTQTYSILWVIK